MKNYQLVLVLKNSVSEPNRKKFLENVKTWLKDAKLTKEEEWGEKALAYTINRENSAFFVNYLFEAKDDMVKDFEKRISASEDVLRHLLLKI